MGGKSSKKKSTTSSPDSDQEDGYFINYPSEVLAHILSFLPPEDIQTCSNVCRLLRELAMSNSLWRVKSIRDRRFIETNMAPFYPVNWQEFYLKQPFTRNLVRNCSGQDDLKHWQVLSNGGDQWLVENGAGSGEKPSELLAIAGDEQCNFATSYSWCRKQQVINLVSCGFDEKMLDQLQPPLKVGEWHAARFDCANVYELEVLLLKEIPVTEEATLDSFKVTLETPQWADNSWKEVSHIFRDYGPGLRYIQFMHQSRDRQFWAGHYGAKIAGSYVKVAFGT